MLLRHDLPMLEFHSVRSHFLVHRMNMKITVFSLWSNGKTIKTYYGLQTAINGCRRYLSMTLVHIVPSFLLATHLPMSLDIPTGNNLCTQSKDNETSSYFLFCKVNKSWIFSVRHQLFWEQDWINVKDCYSFMKFCSKFYFI